MTVVLKRKISKEILTTYVPTALLMMITLATIFIKPFYFEAALGTNLTTMLMMTTIFMTVILKGHGPSVDLGYGGRTHYQHDCLFCHREQTNTVYFRPI